MAKEITQVKNIIEQAIDNYMLHNPQQPLNKEWEYTTTEQVYNGTPEYKIFVVLYPPSRWQRVGSAMFSHPYLGSWSANLNGLSALRVGKPSQRYTGEQLKKMVEQGVAKPMWPELGW